MLNLSLSFLGTGGTDGFRFLFKLHSGVFLGFGFPYFRALLLSDRELVHLVLQLSDFIVSGEPEQLHVPLPLLLALPFLSVVLLSQLLHVLHVFGALGDH